MFVVMLNYVKPLAEVDRLVPAHREYLERGYAAGWFLASGRKTPRTGGVILAQAADREELLARLHQDPFHQGGVAEYEVTEFTASLVAPELAFLKDK